MIGTTRFGAAEYLGTAERQAAYITAALETGDPAVVRDALGVVARARGMAEIAKTADLNRESLYKALGETGNPEFGTVMRVLQALGLRLSARPARDQAQAQEATRGLTRLKSPRVLSIEAADAETAGHFNFHRALARGVSCSTKGADHACHSRRFRGSSEESWLIVLSYR